MGDLLVDHLLAYDTIIAVHRKHQPCGYSPLRIRCPVRGDSKGTRMFGTKRNHQFLRRRAVVGCRGSLSAGNNYLGPSPNSQRMFLSTGRARYYLGQEE